MVVVAGGAVELKPGWLTPAAVADAGVLAEAAETPKMLGAAVVTVVADAC